MLSDVNIFLWVLRGGPLLLFLMLSVKGETFRFHFMYVFFFFFSIAKERLYNVPMVVHFWKLYWKIISVMMWFVALVL